MKRQEKTLQILIREKLSENSNLCAVLDGDTRLSYGALKKYIDLEAAQLTKAGLGSDSLIVLYGPNCLNWIVCCLACWQLGAVVIPLSSRLKSLEIKSALATVNASAMYTLEQSEPPQLAVFSTQKNSEVELPSDLAEIVFTSGSSGKPKAVMLSGQQLISSFEKMASHRNWSRGERLLLTAPLSHVTGLNAGLLTCLLTGSCLCIHAGSQPSKMLAQIAEQGINTVSGPPGLFEQLLRARNGATTLGEHVRRIVLLGAPASQRLLEEIFNTGIEEIYVGYAMTECCTIATTAAQDPNQVLLGTVGHAAPETEIRIQESSSRALDDAGPGEILVRGPGVMIGYYNNQVETNLALDQDGWLHTGDVGYLDGDDRLVISGRLKEMYLSYGFSVYPPEVENLILKNKEVVAVAVVSRPSKLAGEEGVAYVVVRHPRLISVRDLRKWARNNLADIKVPAKFIVLDELPYNSNGKVDKLALKQRLELSNSPKAKRA